MKKNKQNFSGDKKEPRISPTARYEKKLINALTPKFPKWIEGYHLTLMTIPISIGLIIFGYLAKDNYHWLWFSSLMIISQWFTDSFDGALGRYRDTGIPRWGFYMDHFLDYIFLVSILIGYSFLFSGLNKELVYLLIPIFTAFMMNSFLDFGATNKLKVTFLGSGPTEIRAWFVIVNCLIIFFGINIFSLVLPYLLILAVLALAFVVYRTQKQIWITDMKEK